MKTISTDWMTLKKQTGLTIITLMVLLLIAGVMGSLGITAFIKHRCVTHPMEQTCRDTSSTHDK
jgi:Tfp pilus assembly protein PilE